MNETGRRIVPIMTIARTLVQPPVVREQDTGILATLHRPRQCRGGESAF